MALEHVQPGESVCEQLAKESKTVILAFSAGKDSIAAWVQLRKFFKHIIPFFMYLIPDLEFVDEDLKYYEEFFGERIIRVPHPSLYRMLNNLVFQPPERVSIIQNADLPIFTHEDVVSMLREDLAMKAAVFTATGVRAADSPTRYMAVKNHGAINWKKQSFMPIWDWNKARMREELYKSRVKLGIQYRWFGRSFDGIDYRFLNKLKEVAPRDYQRILDWFPLAEVELLRRQYAQEKV